MENWRGLFRERFVIEENTEEKYLRKYDHRTIVEELEHFIEQELDRAREEVYTDLIKEFDMLKEEDRVAKWFILAILKEELSKLTTK